MRATFIAVTLLMLYWYVYLWQDFFPTWMTWHMAKIYEGDIHVLRSFYNMLLVGYVLAVGVMIDNRVLVSHEENKH